MLVHLPCCCYGGQASGGRWRSMHVRLGMLLILPLLPLVSCATGGRGEKIVITDYGTHVLRNKDEASVRTELTILFRRLVDESNEDKAEDEQRVPKELLFVDDVVKVPLRELAAEASTNGLVAKHVLWFLGDKSDIAAMQKHSGINHKPLLAPEVTRKDLAEALRAVRETLKLPVDHFRTEGLSFNRRMTKAYVRVVVGPGAFNCEGWGLMFHLGDAGWELVWSKFEWIS